MTRDRRRTFAGLRPPEAPPELRSRTLRAALAASATSEVSSRTGAPSRPLTDRLWESTPLRLAWALSMVVLLVVNLTFGSEESAGWGTGDAVRGADAGAAPSRTLLASRDVVMRALREGGQEGEIGGEPVRPTVHRAPRPPRRSS